MRDLNQCGSRLTGGLIVVRCQTRFKPCSFRSSEQCSLMQNLSCDERTQARHGLTQLPYPRENMTKKRDFGLNSQFARSFVKFRPKSQEIRVIFQQRLTSAFWRIFS